MGAGSKEKARNAGKQQEQEPLISDVNLLGPKGGLTERAIVSAIDAHSLASPTTPIDLAGNKQLLTSAGYLAQLRYRTQGKIKITDGINQRVIFNK